MLLRQDAMIRSNRILFFREFSPTTPLHDLVKAQDHLREVCSDLRQNPRLAQCSVFLTGDTKIELPTTYEQGPRHAKKALLKDGTAQLQEELAIFWAPQVGPDQKRSSIWHIHQMLERNGWNVQADYHA